MKKTAIAAALALSLGARDHYTKVGGSQTGEDSLNTYSLGVGYRF